MHCAIHTAWNTPFCNCVTMLPHILFSTSSVPETRVVSPLPFPNFTNGCCCERRRRGGGLRLWTFRTPCLRCDWDPASPCWATQLNSCWSAHRNSMLIRTEKWSSVEPQRRELGTFDRVNVNAHLAAWLCHEFVCAYARSVWLFVCVCVYKCALCRYTY